MCGVRRAYEPRVPTMDGPAWSMRARFADPKPPAVRARAPTPPAQRRSRHARTHWRLAAQGTCVALGQAVHHGVSGVHEAASGHVALGQPVHRGVSGVHEAASGHDGLSLGCLPPRLPAPYACADAATRTGRLPQPPRGRRPRLHHAVAVARPAAAAEPGPCRLLRPSAAPGDASLCPCAALARGRWLGVSISAPCARARRTELGSRREHALSARVCIVHQSGCHGSPPPCTCCVCVRNAQGAAFTMAGRHQELTVLGNDVIIDPDIPGPGMYGAPGQVQAAERATSPPTALRPSHRRAWHARAGTSSRAPCVRNAASRLPVDGWLRVVVWCVWARERRT